MKIPDRKDYSWYFQYTVRGYKWDRLVHERFETVLITRFVDVHQGYAWKRKNEEDILYRWNSQPVSKITGVRWEYRITARFRVYFKPC